MSAKEEFIEIYRENITREGADALLDFLENKSDFFTAPSSTCISRNIFSACFAQVGRLDCISQLMMRTRRLCSHNPLGTGMR